MTVANTGQNIQINGLSAAETQKSTPKSEVQATENKAEKTVDLENNVAYQQRLERLAESIDKAQIYTKEAAKVVAQSILKPRVHVVA